jgi:hypothetical protein
VSFATITLCVASQRVFVVVVISLSTQSRNFFVHPLKSRICDCSLDRSAAQHPTCPPTLKPRERNHHNARYCDALEDAELNLDDKS